MGLDVWTGSDSASRYIVGCFIDLAVIFKKSWKR